ncbi:YEATS domain-containing protein 2 [Eumeta japonica]|uniref:YEATS domain-containing protein 2 n=1 Tax=Eumeta variegata TaxID=151549 RepID=A0A4C1Z359_EUMVA|nr:YEATS domain-containing protein 2 [Eumeta japonica]
MESKDEYHDPDYPEVSNDTCKEQRALSEEEKVRRIENIVRREFAKELEYKETEIKNIDQHMVSARRLLHRLRYVLVSRYYNSQKLQLTHGQIQDDISTQVEPRAKEAVSVLLRTEQRRVHPSLRKLLGKKTVDLDEIFKFRSPRNKARRDYKAMIRTRNYTIPAEKHLTTLRPEIKPEIEEPCIAKRSSIEEPSSSKPKKVPRHIEPIMDRNIVKLDEVTRNQQKHRYRVIIGNTSKYAPPASAADRSTHKWLLYIRGPPSCPDVSEVVTSVVVRLHDTYAPHHLVTLDKPPFHISRRGWGEFPAKIELHFAHSSRNRPATVEHTIKLDRNYTGLQILGAETIVDVWLYSTEEMLQYVYDEETTVEPKNDTSELRNDVMDSKNDVVEPVTQQMNGQMNPEQNWMDFFTTESTELDVDEMIIRPVKKEPPEDAKDKENLIEKTSVQMEVNIKQEIDIECQPTDRLNDFDLNKIKKESNESVPEDVNASVENVFHGDIKKEFSDEVSHLTSAPKKRIVKYMDPTTGKIYYLEMDINLDINKVQEIVINSNGNTQTVISPVKAVPNGVKNVKKITKKGGVSLLKPEVQNLLKNETGDKYKSVSKSGNFCHIRNDHCYLGEVWSNTVNYDMSRTVLPIQSNRSPSSREAEVALLEKQKYVKNEPSLYETLCSAVKKIPSVRVAVNYLLSKINLISDTVRDVDFVKHFPFVVENERKYWELDFIKRRNIEWARAKFINKILLEHMTSNETIWRTKQILIFGRLHGYCPVRTDEQLSETGEGWSSWQDTDARNLENIKEVYPDPSDLSTLSIFHDVDYNTQNGRPEISDPIDLTECSDDEVDVTGVDVPVRVKREEPVVTDKKLSILPVNSEEDRSRFLFLERVCAQIGVELRNEDVGNGYCYSGRNHKQELANEKELFMISSAVHAVLLSAMRCFAEELVRGALAAARADQAEGPPPAPPPVWAREWSAPTSVRLQHVARAVRAGRLRLAADAGLATTPQDTYAL